MRKRHLMLAAATIGVASLGVSRQAFAAGYASSLTVSGATVNFDLNEAVNGTGPAGASNGDVKLILNGGAQTIDLGGMAAGMQTYTITTGITNPSLVQVEVTTNDAVGYLNNTGSGLSTPLEVDPPGLAGHNDYGNDPYGIAVNTSPSSPFFGRVYLGNYGTNPGIGIFIENADGSFQGTTAAEAAGFQTPFNAGIPYSGADGPYNLQVGSDGYLYVADWSDGSGGVYREQEAPVVGSGASATGGLINGENVLAGYGEPNVEANGNHDDVDSVVTTGSTAAGNLKVYGVDTHYGANSNMGNQMYLWNVGGTVLTPAGGTLTTANDGYKPAPTPVLNQSATYLGLDTRFWSPASLTTIGPGDQMTMFPGIPGVITSLAIGGPGNQFYVSQSRSNAQQPGLFVLNPADNTSVIWDSLDETMRQQLPFNNGVDYLLALDAIETSPDGRFIVAAQGSGAAYLTPYDGQPVNVVADFGYYVVPLLAGIPDLKLSQAVTTAHGSNRQIAVDAAGNVYTVNATTANQQAWGQGGTTTTVTGSNGTFSAGGVWTANANGNLSDTSNWQVGNLPNGNDQTLTFGAVTSAQRTVSVNNSQTAGAITFSSPNGYVLSNGGGSITMNGLGVNLTAQAGANTISAPVSIQTDAGLYAASNASLTVSNVSYSNSPSIVKNGPGTVTLSNLSLYSDQVMASNAQVASNWAANVQAAKNQSVSQTVSGTTYSGVGNTLYTPTVADSADGNLDVYQGKLVLTPTNGAAVVSELSVYTGASLDLTNNDLIYDYNFSNYTKTSPLAIVQSLVQGGSLFSSSASLANGTTLAVVENDNYTLANHPFTTFDGHPVNVTPVNGSGVPIAIAGTATITTTIPIANPLATPPVPGSSYPASETVTQYNSGTILVKYTYYGDLNLDGKVDGSDFTLMGDGVSGWTGGDLNYDGTINSDDWALFQLGAADYGAGHVQLPEPASVALLGLAAIPMIRRRRA